jgi:hypothetical protein
MREIYIDSRKRKEPYGNSYTMYIQNTLKSVTSVDLVSATIPNTMYNITNGSNIFNVNGEGCSIPPGFYSHTGLYKTINSSNCGVSMSLFENEGKFIFIKNEPFTINLNSPEFINMTGFTNGSLYSNIATTANGIYDATIHGMSFVKSSNVMNLKTYGEYIFLDIEQLRRPFTLEATNDPYDASTSTRFAVIPMDVQSGCIKTFKEMSDYKISIEYPRPIDRIDRLTVRWLDWAGNVINFNGVDENQIVLRFHTHETINEEYEENDTTRETIDKYIEQVKAKLEEETVKKPEKRSMLGKWVVILAILLAITGIYVYR